MFIIVTETINMNVEAKIVDPRCNCKTRSLVQAQNCKSVVNYFHSTRTLIVILIVILIVALIVILIVILGGGLLH